MTLFALQGVWASSVCIKLSVSGSLEAVHCRSPLSNACPFGAVTSVTLRRERA